MAQFRVKSIEGANGIGCEVHGLTAEALDDAGARSGLVDTWIEHGLIVFRGVEGADFQIKLSSVFGDPQPHPVQQERAGGKATQLVRIAYNPDDADIYEVDGKQLGGWLPWHMDLIYLDKVSRGSILRPVLLPEQGGETGFIDKIKLYEQLSPELRDRIEDLYVIYHFDMRIDNLRFARPKSVKVLHLSKLYADIVSRSDQYPRVKHPLVYRQRETGRPVLNFSPYFSREIAGLSKSESDEILEYLGELCLAPGNSYYHKWKSDDMVLWDNWRMLHSAAGVPVNSSRIMERTQLMGDYGLGQLVSAEDAIRDSMRITV